jgi:hypothetical protein
MEATYRITIRKIATGEHKNITRNLTDEAYEKWRVRMNKAENGYVITRIEIDTNLIF